MIVFMLLTVDFETSSELRIERAKGDLQNALGTHKEAVEDSVASSPSNNKKARDESAASDIEREVEELLQEASQANLQDAANAERSTEVKEVLDEFICGGCTERIRDVSSSIFSTHKSKTRNGR